MMHGQTKIKVVEYLLLRQHISAPELRHHLEISLRILHCIVSSEAQFEAWWWPSARAETCCIGSKYPTTLLVVFWLYYPVPSYYILWGFRHTSVGELFMIVLGCGRETLPRWVRGQFLADPRASKLKGNTGAIKRGVVCWNL